LTETISLANFNDRILKVKSLFFSVE